MQYQTSKKVIAIALIGCGSVGVSFLYQLNRQKDKFKRIEIYVFNPSIDLASGYAYTTANNDFLLNADNTEMSICPDNPLHFNQWLRDNNFPYENSLAPRKVFGNYLKDCLSSLLKQVSDDFVITHIDEKVVDCWVINDTETCITTRTNIFRVNMAIFSHGAIQNTLSQSIDAHGSCIDNFYKNPHTLEQIENGSKVLLLGSSLTMVDACLILKYFNKSLYLTNTSRSGYFPAKIFNSMNKLNLVLLDIPLHDVAELILYINLNLSYLLNRWFDIGMEIIKYEMSNYNHIYIEYLNENPREIDLIYQFSLKLDILMDALFPKLKFNEVELFKKIEKYFARYLSGIPKVNLNKLSQFWVASAFNVQRLESLKPFKNGFKVKFQHTKKMNFFIM